MGKKEREACEKNEEEWGLHERWALYLVNAYSDSSSLFRINRNLCVVFAFASKNVRIV